MTLTLAQPSEEVSEEVQTIQWAGQRYVYHPKKVHFESLTNPQEIFKTKEGYIVRRCIERRDGKLLVEVDESPVRIPLVMGPNGEQYSTLSLTGVQEMVKDITARLVNLGSRKLKITSQKYESPILKK